jgi:hypothetical protein
MRVDVVRCAACNTIVSAPSTRSKRVTCDACFAKQRKAALAGTPRRHHIPIIRKDALYDEDDPLLGHWPG